MEAVRQSFSPKPDVTVLESVVDAKSWMQEVTPALHDHLKAHQFKNEMGVCKMYYKEQKLANHHYPQVQCTCIIIYVHVYGVQIHVYVHAACNCYYFGE